MNKLIVETSRDAKNFHSPQVQAVLRCQSKSAHTFFLIMFLHQKMSYFIAKRDLSRAEYIYQALLVSLKKHLSTIGYFYI